MNTVRCQICKRPFEFSGLPPKCCPECYLRDEEQYQRVRDLVKAHPGINILEVVEITGVPHVRILGYLREERLEIVPTETTFRQCSICGQIINTGSLCAACIEHNQNKRVENRRADEPSHDKKIVNVENINDNRFHTNAKTKK